MVMVTAPPIDKPSETMILMAGFDPYSHVIPAFPPEIPFVRVQSNFTSPEQDKGINAVIAARVTGHKGPYKLLIPHHHFYHATPALGHFGLTFSPQNCQAVIDHGFDSRLVLCDVERTTNKPVIKQ